VKILSQVRRSIEVYCCLSYTYNNAVFHYHDPDTCDHLSTYDNDASAGVETAEVVIDWKNLNCQMYQTAKNPVIKFATGSAEATGNILLIPLLLYVGI